MPITTIFLRQDLTNRLVQEAYGGFDELSAEWEETVKTSPLFPEPKQRSTIYRWLIKGVPAGTDTSEFQMIALCALLDVDPLILFDFEKNGFFSKFAKLRRLIQLGKYSLGGLAPLLELLSPDDVWPSERIAKLCYGRSWFSHQFKNAEDWNSADYILVKVQFIEQLKSHPLAVHIAYRRTTSPDTMWRYYGSVLAMDGELKLYNENGDYQTMEQVNPGEIQFRTYFGGRPVEWRIVSLHDFSIEKDYPFNDMKIIGFNW